MFPMRFQTDWQADETVNETYTLDVQLPASGLMIIKATQNMESHIFLAKRYIGMDMFYSLFINNTLKLHIRSYFLFCILSC